MQSSSILPRICIALGIPDAARLMEHARREAEHGERFLEFRLDYLPDPLSGIPLIRDFLQAYPDATLLATCRRHQNHGRFNGSIEEQLHILTAAIDAGARAIDVEIETAENPNADLHFLQSSAHLVVSYHNFDGTPALDPVVRRMLRVPAAAYKIVTTARKPSDNFRVLSLAKTYPKVPFILLAMTEMGFPTRVLCTSVGGVYTYAAPCAAEGTAAGQVAARQLRQLYRVDKIQKPPKVFGVIADPVHHSISPAVHNRALQSRRIDAVYLPFLVAPLQLKDFFLFAEKMPLSAFSVTIPHKQRILRYLDAVDPLSRRIGAVNTVWKKAGKWRGTNTDAEGVRVPLERRVRLSKSKVLIVGNGGAARAAAFTVAGAGAKVFIAGRNPDRIRALARITGAEALPPEKLQTSYFDVLIHATPVGMWPNSEECYFDGAIPANLVFDLVYTPRETALIQRARAQKKEVICGIEMFIEQAAQQFQTFTGESAPRAVMERAADEALTEQQHHQFKSPFVNHNHSGDHAK